SFACTLQGCGGGPVETNLSSFLVKPYASKWTDGCTGIEALGTGTDALSISPPPPCSCFAITHAHLDHIAGLIISSAACRPPPRPVYGIRRTIANIERLMDGGVWPMLGGWDDSVTIGRAYHYKKCLPKPQAVGTAPAAGGAEGECYDSTAFFVREEQSGRELLFFGDVEPGPSSSSP
ncbi:uncharacterized protein RHOBADRAFT_8424, partial [Rhodotorula graminis WP1]